MPGTKSIDQSLSDSTHERGHNLSRFLSIIAVRFIACLGVVFSAPVLAQTFTDVPPDHWAYTYIESLAASGITAGCGDGKYCPSSSVNRDQMAVFLERGMRGAAYRPPAATGTIFGDVGAGDFAASYIEQLFRDGITAGCGSGNYCPAGQVTRDQMAVFLLRAEHGSGYRPPGAAGVFSDVPVSYWAASWIEQLAAEGITAGCGGGKYCPNSPVNRDQMAVFLVRTFSLPIVVPPSGLSGTITAASGSFIDSDVNDPAAAYAANDTIATVQSIGNPATVGGYANEPGFGEPGRSQVVGDIDDGYRVTLAVGQVLTLTIGDPNAADLDLYLLDEAGYIVASSEGVGVTETITVTTAGTYIIDVYAYSGAANYILTIGQAVGIVSTPRLSVLSEFVPGELIARFKPAKTGEQSIGMRLSVMGLQMTASDSAATQRPVLIRIDETFLTATTKDAAPGAAATKEVLPLGIAGKPELERKWRTLSAIKQLGKQPGVRYAEPNYILKPSAVPNDQFYNSQWHYPIINLPQAWDITTGSSAVIVAVIDTGVLLGHPDLQGQLISGYDFISDPSRARDGDGRDPNPNDAGDICCGASSSFHGTHVAGTIAAATNNAIGVAGVAWNARIMPLRVLGVGGGTTDDINQAILYAARLANGSGTLPAQRAAIINMSLGGPGFSQGQQDVITQARNQGVIIIASAGNEAQQGNPINYPASYTGVVSVGAVAIDRTRAPYSTFNAFVDIAAPGGDMSRDLNGDGYGDGVVSTMGDDSSGVLGFIYRFSQGTSMAAPHVAGVAALMKAVNPVLTPAQFDALLSSGQLTQDLGSPGRDDQFGYGLVNAYAAVVASQTTPTLVPAQLVATPSGLNFGTQGTNATLSLVNGGGGSLSVTSVSDDASWLTVGAASDPATGLGTRTVTVNRTGLVVGTYTASITIVSTANTVTVPVIMQVSASNVAANVGFLYVLLLDPVTFATVYQAELNASNGVYQFSIPNMVAGSYLVLAGSDNNNDFIICDAGEACGGYPALDSLSPLEVSGNVTGVNFGAGFNAVIQPQSAGATGSRGYPRFKGKRVGH